MKTQDKIIQEAYTNMFENSSSVGKSALPGVYVHETTPSSAANIMKNGFKPSHEGIFFNRENNNYSGGGYGGSHVKANLDIHKLLDLSGDDLPDHLADLADKGDGEEIASYARKHGYHAWADDLQISVLDHKRIKVLK